MAAPISVTNRNKGVLACLLAAMMVCDLASAH